MKLNRYSDILCSVMIPTRCRFTYLMDAVKSLQDRAHRPEQIEIIVRLEEEDPDLVKTQAMLLNVVHRSKLKMITGPRGGGFADVGDMYNKMASISTGDWLLVFNDDCVMMTNDWDSLLSEFEPTVLKPDWLLSNSDYCIIKNQKGRGNPFPIISRKLYKLMGRLSANTPHLDSYLERIAGPLGIEVQWLGIWIKHLRPVMKDETRQASAATYPVTGPLFWRPPVQDQLKFDRSIVAAKLGIPNPTKFKQGGQEVKP